MHAPTVLYRKRCTWTAVTRGTRKSACVCVYTHRDQTAALLAKYGINAYNPLVKPKDVSDSDEGDEGESEEGESEEEGVSSDEEGRGPLHGSIDCLSTFSWALHAACGSTKHQFLS